MGRRHGQARSGEDTGFGGRVRLPSPVGTWAWLTKVGRYAVMMGGPHPCPSPARRGETRVRAVVGCGGHSDRVAHRCQDGYAGTTYGSITHWGGDTTSGEARMALKDFYQVRRTRPMRGERGQAQQAAPRQTDAAGSAPTDGSGSQPKVAFTSTPPIC